ncbi:MAG TPA: hypothetical protein VMS60_00725 [Solirubrobacterales bacterium]|nr:hypothetical protein [Solirubrobacterales bacterium]
MNGRRAVVGLCMLCALLVSAFAAQSASAIKGTTAVTCKSGEGDTGGATFNEAHCKPSSPSGSFGHYKINENTTTELTGDNAGAPTKLKATLGGVATTLTSSKLTGTGSMENRVEPNGEHYVHGEGHITYEEVLINPFSKCFVYEDTEPGIGTQNVIKTQELTATTTGQGDGLKFQPTVGTVFARFWILDKNKKTSAEGGECTISGTYSVSGSLIAKPDGATANTTHAEVTEQNTLKMGTGEPTIKAGLEGSLTIKGKHPGIGGDTFKPLSVTTYATNT